MNSVLIALIIALVAYLIGSLSFAIVTAKLMKLDDPRSYGSGNPGATNVLRSGNKKAAAFTLLGDLLKGWLAVFVTMQLVAHYNLSPWLITVAAIAVFLGHVYSLMLGFKGGKGVATGVGILLALDPLLGLICIGTWLLVAVLFKYSSLAALVSAAMAPIYYLFLHSNNGTFSNAEFIAIIVIVAWLIYKHKKNIHNLLHGKESKIGDNKQTAPLATNKKAKKRL